MKEKFIKDRYYIAVFDSRNYAVQLYQYLRRRNYNQFQLISTPCKIQTGCGYSIRFDILEDYYILMKEADKINRKPSIVYEAERVNKQRVLKKIKI